MSDLGYDELLADRFDRLIRTVDGPDWGDVVARSAEIASVTDAIQRRERQRHFAPMVVVAAAVALVTMASAAFGLPQKITKLFSSSEPAPARTQIAFSTLDASAPPGLETGVIPDTARKAFEVALPQRARATLWLAPTAKGGHCEMVVLVDAAGRSRGGAGPGCDDRPSTTSYGLIVPGPITTQGIERGPVVITGDATIDEAMTAMIQFEDGTETEIPLTWISAPIDAGFFVYGVPPANWERGRLPTQLRYLNGDGDVVGRHRLDLNHVLNLPQAGKTPDGGDER